MEEFGTQSKTASILKDHVEKLALSLINDVVITDDLVSLLLFRDDVAPSGNAVAHEGEPNSDEAILNHV